MERRNKGTRLKVFLAHNRYKFRGGEDVAFRQESELLEDHSYDTVKYIVDNSEELDSLIRMASLLFRTHYSKSSYRKVRTLLQKERPHIVHVHNFFPLISPSIFDACLDEQIPSVLTLHNYRLLHPNGLLLHNGKIDERSIHGSAYSCVLDGVYRDSILQTAVVAHMIEYHRKKGTWNNKVTRFIALSEFAKSKFIEGGLPGDLIEVKPNFVDDHLEESLPELNAKRDSYFLFVGRISSEKGVDIMLQAWEQFETPPPLKIIGEGPLENTLRKKHRNLQNVEWLGPQSREDIFGYLKKALGLIFPSECYEGSPLTILEAFSMGTPVLSSNMGSQAELVDDHQNGLLFKVGDPVDLAAKVETISVDTGLFQELSAKARDDYEQKYTPDANFMMLEKIYKEALNAG